MQQGNWNFILLRVAVKKPLSVQFWAILQITRMSWQTPPPQKEL